MYFENDIRVSNGVQQLKLVSHKDTYLKYYNGMFLPCSYTIATETNTEYDLYLSNAKKTITRYTLYDQHSIRITLDYENNTFYLNGETENVTEAEQFYATYYSFLKLYASLDISHHYENIVISAYNNITSRKFEIFNIGDELNCLAVKFKYDGFKAKLVIDSDTGIFFGSVVGVIQRVELPGILRKFKKMIFQLECMDDKLIITDVIGVYIRNVLYAPTPLDTLNFFKSLKINEKNLHLTIKGRPYRLYTQHEMSEHEAIDRYDGYIFVTDRREFKVKLPTIDLHLKKKFFYLYDGEKKIQVSDFQYDYEDGIYEVMRHPQDFDNIYRLIILRQRFDRHYPCSKSEYEKFCESNHKWTEHLQNNPVSL